MHLVAEKKKWALTVFDKLISGVLFGNFVLIASSIFIGYFSNHVNIVFQLYTSLGLFALVLFLFRVLIWEKRHLLLNIKFSDLELKVYVLPILLFALFVIFLHTLYLEYDAIYSFLPYAKSIALTGSMNYNVYAQSTLSTGMPPVLPVIYSWALTTIDNLNAMGIYNDMRLHDILRPIPAAYFTLTVLVIYLIARETLQKKHAFLSAITFISFPSTILTLSASTYYLDLGFVFYIVSAILCLVKSLKTRKPIWFFLTGIAGSLLLLTKELAIFIIPLIFSMFILFSSIKYRKAIFVILSTSPFYLIFIWDILASPIGWILVRQLPVFALSFVLYYLSKTVKGSNDLLTWKNLVLLLVPFIPSFVFFLRGIVFLDSLYSIWGPAFNEATYLFHSAMGTQEAIEVTNFFRWDIPFLSLGLGVSYLVPILFSIIYLFRKRNQGDKPVNLLVLMILFTLLETMSFTLVGSQPESRRMYYFAPILAIFAANGLMLFDDFLKIEYFICLCTLFNSFFIGYIWLYRFPFQTMLGLSYLKTRVNLASALDLVFLSMVFICAFLVFPFMQKRFQVEDIKNSKFRMRTRKRVSALPIEFKNLSIEDVADSEVKVHARKRVPAFSVEQKKPRHAKNIWSPRVGFHSRRRIIYVSLLILSCLVVVSPVIPIWLQGVNRNFDFFSFQYDVHEPVWENGILIVGYYYTDRIDDHYVTVSFGGGALRYFANRSVIDLATVIGVQSMQNILTINASGDLLQTLNDSNIKYFLIPRSNNSFYDLYLGFREDFYLFKFLEQNRHFSLIQEFPYYQLIRLE